MPKRWRVVGGSSYGLELVDDQGNVLASTEHMWDEENLVDDMVEEIREGAIEFTDGNEEPPRRYRRRPRP
jgi:hypothetical protein